MVVLIITIPEVKSKMNRFLERRKPWMFNYSSEPNFNSVQVHRARRLWTLRLASYYSTTPTLHIPAYGPMMTWRHFGFVSGLPWRKSTSICSQSGLVVKPSRSGSSSLIGRLPRSCFMQECRNVCARVNADDRWNQNRLCWPSESKHIRKVCGSWSQTVECYRRKDTWRKDTFRTHLYINVQNAKRAGGGYKSTHAQTCFAIHKVFSVYYIAKLFLFFLKDGLFLVYFYTISETTRVDFISQTQALEVVSLTMFLPNISSNTGLNDLLWAILWPLPAFSKCNFVSQTEWWLSFSHHYATVWGIYFCGQKFSLHIQGIFFLCTNKHFH